LFLYFTAHSHSQSIPAIQTDLSRSLSPEDKQLIESIVDGKWISLDQGTSTILIAALDPALCEPQESVYLSKGRIADAASYTHDSEIAERLWKLSEELTSQSRQMSESSDSNTTR
jgi:hypothetical protein